MVTKDKETLKRKQTEVMDRLQRAGIKALPGKKTPKDGTYSGVVGSERKERVLNV
jgi:hypothetical protein